MLGGNKWEIRGKLQLWRQALETYDLCLSESKTEYMECMFRKKHITSIFKVKVGDHTMSHTV